MIGGTRVTPAAGQIDWRRALLSWLLAFALVLATLAFPVIIVQAVTLRESPWVAVMVVLYLLLLTATCFPRLPYVLRALGLLIGLCGVAVLGFLRVGFQVGPGIGSALFVVLAGLLLGRRMMIAVFCFTLCAILAVGAFHLRSGGWMIARGIGDPMSFVNWIRVAIVYALFTGVLAAAVSFVVDHIERLLAERTEALARLQAESRSKEQAEHALDEAQRTILQMQKLEALGRLAGGVAHDFNNTLVVILGYADLLLKRLDDREELRRGLNEITAAGNHAAGLTRQLLSFGRRAVSSPSVVSVRQLFADLESMLRRVLPEHIRLSLHADDALPAIFVDPGQMQQVLLNLCMNARDALPNGGELELTAREIAAARPPDTLPPGHWVSISVRDTGVGMDETTRMHVFEPFFTTKGDHGTGLGLSTAYGIIVASGGHVLVDSALGQGSTFRLLLPPSDADAEQPAGAVAKPVPKPVSRASTILVAEDEPGVRELIVSALRAEGHTVLAAPDGNVALEIARRYRGTIDLLCTDGVMPNTDSMRLIADFRVLFPRANVLVCSGHSEALALDPRLQRELSYLQKPFTAATLASAVVDALGATRAPARANSA